MKGAQLEGRELVAELTTLVSNITELVGSAGVPSRAADEFNLFQNALKTFNRGGQNPSEEFRRVRSVAIHARAFGEHLKQSSLDSAVKDLAMKLAERAKVIKTHVDDSPMPLTQLGEAKVDGDPEPQSSRPMGILTPDRIQVKLEKMNKELRDAEKRANTLDVRLSDLNEQVARKLEEASALYEKSVPEIAEKKGQIDKMLGHASGRVIAGDFAEGATSECAIADWLRWGSLGCMALIVAIVGYSFYDSMHDVFDLREAVFRIVLAFLLSIPAGYLARESAKHREQQYLYLQTSLDLKAISPYMASLPEAEQHRLKSEIARRLFGQRSGKPAQSEPSRLDVNEIVFELIKQLGKAKTSKADGDT